MILENFRKNHQIWSQYEEEKPVTKLSHKLKKEITLFNMIM
jgi:hypothetical protein